MDPEGAGMILPLKNNSEHPKHEITNTEKYKTKKCSDKPSILGNRITVLISTSM